MRIATWNLAGRWTPAHLELMEGVDADVWLLTEVSDRLELPGYTLHCGTPLMARRRHWAAVASRAPLRALPDPHPASAAAVVGEMTFVSTILPWRGSGGDPPWRGERHAERTVACVDELVAALPRSALVWGGDWNHALVGPETSGSIGGRKHVLAAVAELNLAVPTAELGRSAQRGSIDHIAVGRSVTVRSARRIDHAGLSDHDAYVVDADLSEVDQGLVAADEARRAAKGP